MEKIFQPNKWFVGFCAMLILVFVLLQVVQYARLSDMAKIIGTDIFTWGWPDKNISSSCQITDAKVLSKTHTDAVVEIKGKQVLSAEEIKPDTKSETTECSAVLTLYRVNDRWELGKVELK
jgi:hypothetical protein